MDTRSLIDQLSGEAGPVRRLRPPWMRAALWLAIGLVVVAAVVVAMKGLFDPRMVLADRRVVVEELATLATAVLAALAAFQSTVPGASRKWLWLPLVPLAIWLASVGQGCLDDYVRLGADGLKVRFDGGCVLPMVLIGIVPTILIVTMLRQGAPLTPRLSVGLAGLAVAALANFGLTLFHVGDVSIMVLVWHFGFVAVVCTVASWCGPVLLGWRHQARRIA